MGCVGCGFGYRGGVAGIVGVVCNGGDCIGMWCCAYFFIK